MAKKKQEVKAELKREKPTQKFEIEKQGDTYASVSIEEHPYMATDGYSTVVTRKMTITKERLIDELDKLRVDLDEGPKMIKSARKDLTLMRRDYAAIKTESFKQMLGKILNEKENNVKAAVIAHTHDKKVLKHYEKLLEMM